MAKQKAKRLEYLLNFNSYIYIIYVSNTLYFLFIILFYLQIDLDGILELNPQLRSNIPSISLVAQNGSTNIPTNSKLARVNITF